jgi:hypothetical protein
MALLAESRKLQREDSKSFRLLRGYCLGFRIFTLEFAAFRQQGHRVHQIL